MKGLLDVHCNTDQTHFLYTHGGDAHTCRIAVGMGYVKQTSNPNGVSRRHSLRLSCRVTSRRCQLRNDGAVVRLPVIPVGFGVPGPSGKTFGRKDGSEAGI